MQPFTANAVLWMGLSLGIGAPAVASTPSPDSPLALQEAKHLDRLPPVAPWGKAPIDNSGRKQTGHASYYAAKFAHRKMADGNHMNPQANVAASKTLPFGTTAKVINLQNGKSATVRVEDRGPFVAGRVMDVTFKVAQELEMGKHGLVPVEVKPIVVPQPSGEVKLGAGAANLTPQEIREVSRAGTVR
jgi:rare lipoprotein A